MMDIAKLIASIESEQKKAKVELTSEEGMKRLQEVASTYSGEDMLVWSDELLKEIQSRPQIPLYLTKIAPLDVLIGGLHPQQLVTISAHSKHGKTAFGLYLLEMMEELNPVMIPLEQSNEEIITQRHENGQSVPRFLSPRRLAPKALVSWIEQRIIEGIAKYNTKLVLIDHLGYIDNYGEDGKYKKENLAYRIGEVMRELKSVAKRWNVIIVLLSQISQKDEGHPPTLEDIKNSSDILQESDMVIMLWRKNTAVRKVRVYENKTMVSVMANRRTGKNGSIGLCFDPSTGHYFEDNQWVKDMMKMAEQRVDDEFDY